jgi:hypothetical protein
MHGIKVIQALNSRNTVPKFKESILLRDKTGQTDVLSDFAIMKIAGA